MDRGSLPQSAKHSPGGGGNLHLLLRSAPASRVLGAGSLWSEPHKRGSPLRCPQHLLDVDGGVSSASKRPIPAGISLHQLPPQSPHSTRAKGQLTPRQSGQAAQVPHRLASLRQAAPSATQSTEEQLGHQAIRSGGGDHCQVQRGQQERTQDPSEPLLELERQSHKTEAGAGAGETLLHWATTRASSSHQLRVPQLRPVTLGGGATGRARQ